MDERLLNLLRTVVDEYVATAEPVGSQSLVTRYRLDVSPATVRNWFAELEEAGCLTQPHTSGGRIPTEKGFQTYLEHFVEEKPVGKRERDILQQSAALPPDDGKRLKSVAKTLAELSGLATVVGLGHADTFYTGLSQLFGQIEFQNWKRVVNLTEILDHLDDTMRDLRSRSFDAPQILLGRSCPFGVSCGTVLISHPEGLVGILGPVRMDYQHALSLLYSTRQILT